MKPAALNHRTKHFMRVAGTGVRAATAAGRRHRRLRSHSGGPSAPPLRNRPRFPHAAALATALTAAVPGTVTLAAVQPRCN